MPIDAKDIKLLVLDVDGVLTDGTKTYDLAGKVISKRYCDQDFTAIKRFKASGVKVCWLTGDPYNLQIAHNRQIDAYSAKNENNISDKVARLAFLEQRYGVNSNNICYVGDDIHDIGIMQKVGLSVRP